MTPANEYLNQIVNPIKATSVNRCDSGVVEKITSTQKTEASSSCECVPPIFLRRKMV